MSRAKILEASGQIGGSNKLARWGSARSKDASNKLAEDIYYKDLSRAKILSKEEFLEVWKKWKETDDERCRSKLLESVLRLNVTIAKEFRKTIKKYPHIGLEDLVSEANMASIRALEKWVPNMGSGFVALAAVYARTAIRRLITFHAHHGIHLPVTTRQKVVMMQEEGFEVVVNRGRKKGRVTAKRKAELFNAFQSFNCAYFSEYNEPPTRSIGPSVSLTEQMEEEKQKFAGLEFIKRNVSPEDFELLYDRFAKEQTWTEIGKKLDLGREITRRKCESLVRHLRRNGAGFVGTIS